MWPLAHCKANNGGTALGKCHQGGYCHLSTGRSEGLVLLFSPVVPLMPVVLIVRAIVCAIFSVSDSWPTAKRQLVFISCTLHEPLRLILAGSLIAAPFRHLAFVVRRSICFHLKLICRTCASLKCSTRRNARRPVSSLLKVQLFSLNCQTENHWQKKRNPILRPCVVLLFFSHRWESESESESESEELEKHCISVPDFAYAQHALLSILMMLVLPQKRGSYPSVIERRHSGLLTPLLNHSHLIKLFL